VVVVLATGVRGLVPRDALPHLEALDELQARQ
jgi:hypothetical protein